MSANVNQKFSVNLWGSHPEEGNDDCHTGDDFETFAEAMQAATNWRTHFNAGKPEFLHYTNRCVAYVEIVGPGIEGLIKNEKFRPRRDDDSDWKRETAVQAGMAFGCDGYNDEMGF